MSETVATGQLKIIVENIHMTSLGVNRDLISGATRADALLSEFSHRLLSDLLQPRVPDWKASSSTSFRSGVSLAPHTVHIGYPFDDDLQSCCPE